MTTILTAMWNRSWKGTFAWNYWVRIIETSRLPRHWPISNHVSATMKEHTSLLANGRKSTTFNTASWWMWERRWSLTTYQDIYRVNASFTLWTLTWQVGERLLIISGIDCCNNAIFLVRSSNLFDTTWTKRRQRCWTHWWWCSREYSYQTIGRATILIRIRCSSLHEVESTPKRWLDLSKSNGLLLHLTRSNNRKNKKNIGHQTDWSHWMMNHLYSGKRQFPTSSSLQFGRACWNVLCRQRPGSILMSTISSIFASWTKSMQRYDANVYAIFVYSLQW